MTDADVPVQSGVLIPIDGSGSPIYFQWNPHKISHSKKAPWNKLKVAGREQPYLQYGCGEAQSIDIEFDLSRSDRDDSYVKNTIDQLLGLTACTAGGFVKHPPRVKFMLGNGINKTCVVTHIKISYGPLYNPLSLLPYEARVNMSLLEYK